MFLKLIIIYSCITLVKFIILSNFQSPPQSTFQFSIR